MKAKWQDELPTKMEIRPVQEQGTVIMLSTQVLTVLLFRGDLRSLSCHASGHSSQDDGDARPGQRTGNWCDDKFIQVWSALYTVIFSSSLLFQLN